MEYHYTLKIRILLDVYMVKRPKVSLVHGQNAVLCLGMIKKVHIQVHILVTIYRSFAKEGPLWIVHPSPMFASISCWGLKLIWKSAHLQSFAGYLSEARSMDE